MPGWYICVKQLPLAYNIYMCVFFAVGGPFTTFKPDGLQLTQMHTSDGNKSAIIYSLAALLGVSVIIIIILIVK